MDLCVKEYDEAGREECIVNGERNNGSRERNISRMMMQT